MPTIRTTLEPWREIVVTESEYLSLLRQGLIYDDEPPPPPPPSFTDQQYDELDDPESEAATRIVEAVLASIDSGGLVAAATAAVIAEVGPDIDAAEAAAAAAANAADSAQTTANTANGTANAALPAADLTTQARTFLATQTFDPDEGFQVGTELKLSFVDGFFGQRLHLTGTSVGVMPYMEVAPTTRGGEDVGGAVAGFQLYLTPGGGGVPDREFLAIEASGDNASNPLEFKISPWASGTGVLRPIGLWDGTHKVATIRNMGTTGAFEIQYGSRLTFVSTETATTIPVIFQHQGTLGSQYRSYSTNQAVEPYIFLSKNRGTIAAPSTPASGDNLGSLRYGANDAGTERAGVVLRSLATEAWVYASARGTKFQINTTPTGTASTQTQVEFNEPGANEVGFLVRVDRAGVKTLDRVTIGAPDSGGTGRRALTVAN